MRILITNDDGIEAKGIRRLAEAARKMGEVWVIAPHVQRSSVSHCLSFGGTLEIKEYDYNMEGVKAFSCTGTPADCVKAGVTKFMDKKPNVILSGINYGYNIGDDIMYSGTANAAFEGSLLGIPSIAVSKGTGDSFEVVDKYLDRLLKECIEKPLPKDQIWNLNFPDCPVSECNGVLRNRTVSRDPFWNDEYHMEKIGEGIYSLRHLPDRKWKGGEGTDLAAIVNKYVSVGIAHNCY